MSTEPIDPAETSLQDYRHATCPTCDRPCVHAHLTNGPATTAHYVCNRGHMWMLNVTTEPLDPAAIMAEHKALKHGWDDGAECWACSAPHPCLPYRLAAEVIRWRKAWQGEDRSHAETQAENTALREELATTRALLKTALLTGP